MATYNEYQTFSATLGAEAIKVISKPGMPHWDAVSPASRLLAAHAQVERGMRALALGCGHGALGVWLARQTGHVTLLDTNVIALSAATQTLRRNGATNAAVHQEARLWPDGAGSYDVALLELPKGRGLTRRWLAEVWAALRPGGTLYLAGPNDEGIRPAIDDAGALLGLSMQLGYKERNRIGCAVKQADAPTIPPWIYEAGIALGTWHELAVEVAGLALRLQSLPGVFSYDRLDDGTALLLEHLELPPNARVLDVGCGYGVIGLALARRGAAQVDMIDTDLAAVACTRENIALNDIASARALPSDVLSAVSGERYDLIVSNPPFHVGKAVDYEIARAIIEQSRAALVPGGQLWVVANRFIRYDQELQRFFGRVERAGQDGRYQVFVAYA